MKMAVITDSASQISAQEAIALGIYLVPLQIMVQDNVLMDGVDIDEINLFKRIQSEGIMPKTSQPTTGDITSKLEIIKASYDEVMAVPIGTGLSSTLQGMAIAADMMDLKITLIDSKTACHNQRQVVLYTKQLIDQGLSSDTIKTKVEAFVEDAGTFIIPNDLNYLKRGGRMTAAAALLGGLLKICPILKLNSELGGKIDVFGKVRTLKKAYMQVIDYFEAQGVNAQDYEITVGDALNEIVADEIEKEVRMRFPNIKVIRVPLPAVVGVHTGPGCVGLQYIRRIDKKA